jgi:deoxyribonuclease V
MYSLGILYLPENEKNPGEINQETLMCSCTMFLPVFYNSVMKEDLWPENISEAREIQLALKEKVKIVPLKKMPEFIAAADAAFSEAFVFAAASLYKLPGLDHQQDAIAIAEVRFNYMPGLFAFREGKTVINALKKLTTSPGVILIDGHGIAHPDGIGIASHIGVILDIPVVGCAKTRLVGEYEEPAPEKGSWTYLYYQGMKVGAVLRTRRNVKPLFISPGHLVDIESSVEIVMKCVLGYRIPEPLRMADRLSKKMTRDYQEGLR